MPQPFENHIGIAAILARDNVDTDQIIPSREMKTVDRKGLGEGLFAGLRYTRPGGRDPNPDFILNQPNQVGTSILISGWNFGCGSSREHAVWALQEFGIKAIIAKSFGEIFYGNCLNNGILPVILPEADIDLIGHEQGFNLEINLVQQRINSDRFPDWSAHFEIDAYPKRLLMEGLDPIGLTLKHRGEIDAFFELDAKRRPWAYSSG